VLLAGSLIASRLNPRVLAVQYGIALVVNIALNLLLIPLLDETGAALAFLVTQVAFAVMTLRVSMRAVGRPHVRETLGAAVVAGVAMAVVVALLRDVIAAGLVAAAVVYAVLFVVVERRVARNDFEFVIEMARSRLPSRLGARLPS
jgi:O-antigen/teichoic acid export membrane protein